MDNWITIINDSELAEGKPIAVKAGGKPVVILKISGELFALKNECPHLGCRMHRGDLSGYLLTCPCHDWVFDVRTGEFITAPEIKMPVYPVKTSDGKIMIRMEDD